MSNNQRIVALSASDNLMKGAWFCNSEHECHVWLRRKRRAELHAIDTGMIVIKIGGSVVDGLHLTTLEDIKSIAENNRPIFVHGGGKAVTIVATKLGKEQRLIISPGGVRSRYTDKETAEIYTMVMSGKINKAIVGMLARQGINAVGIAGVDGGMIRAERKKKLLIINEKGRKMVIEGGYTGKINAVNPALIHNLVNGGYVPVISPIALSEEFDFLNVDGDRARRM